MKISRIFFDLFTFGILGIPKSKPPLSSLLRSTSNQAISLYEKLNQVPSLIFANKKKIRKQFSFKFEKLTSFQTKTDKKKTNEEYKNLSVSIANEFTFIIHIYTIKFFKIKKYNIIQKTTWYNQDEQIHFVCFFSHKDF